jgi:hypothetical protein
VTIPSRRQSPRKWETRGLTLALCHQLESHDFSVCGLAVTGHRFTPPRWLSPRSIARARHGHPAESDADRKVDAAAAHVRSALETFTVQESGRDLGLDDRLIYLSIIGTLTTFVSITTQPSPALSRGQRLRNQRHALMNIHTYLSAFDADLAGVYARDSKTTPPAE